MITLRPEEPRDGPEIENLLDTAFEPERHTRPSYRLRDGVVPRATLCFVACYESTIFGTIRFWPVSIGESGSGVLLGPIAVLPAHEGRGIGSSLILRGLEAARQEGESVVIAVGAPGYLGRFGFLPAAEHGMGMPELTDPGRFLALELTPGALAGVSGEVGRARH